MRGAVLAVFVLGCAKAPALAPESFTMETSPNVAIEPLDEPMPFGPSPWVGRLKRTTHHYSNGCTDQRVIEVLALVVNRRPVPIILGWRTRAAGDLEEPQFLRKEEELPEASRTACVKITGAVVVYAHEGYVGMPAYAIRASDAEPAPCP